MITREKRKNYNKYKIQNYIIRFVLVGFWYSRLRANVVFLKILLITKYCKKSGFQYMKITNIVNTEGKIFTLIKNSVEAFKASVTHKKIYYTTK